MISLLSSANRNNFFSLFCIINDIKQALLSIFSGRRWKDLIGTKLLSEVTWFSNSNAINHTYKTSDAWLLKYFQIAFLIRNIFAGFFNTVAVIGLEEIRWLVLGLVILSNYFLLIYKYIYIDFLMWYVNGVIIGVGGIPMVLRFYKK